MTFPVPPLQSMDIEPSQSHESQSTKDEEEDEEEMNEEEVDEEEVNQEEEKRELGPPPTINIPPHALQLSIHLRKTFDIHDILKRACVRSILFHILYSRGIIPSPAEDLLQASRLHHQQRQQQQGTKRKRLTTTQRKEIKHGIQLKTILDDLDSIFGFHNTTSTHTAELGDDSNDATPNQLYPQFHSGVKAILLTLGPSFANPREQYLLQFHSFPPAHNHNPHSTTSTQSNVNQYDASNNKLTKERYQRMEQEMSRRCIREFLRATCQTEHAPTFQYSSSDRMTRCRWKVGLACLLDSKAVESIAMTMTSPSPPLSSPVHSPSCNVRVRSERLVVRHNFCVKTPRMVSVKRHLHRPFVVLDVIPGLVPPPCSFGDNFVELARFQPCCGDVWMSLRSFMKGFAA